MKNSRCQCGVILFSMIFILNFSLLFSEDIEMIYIEGVKTSIGSDEFKIVPMDFINKEAADRDANKIRYPYKEHLVKLDSYYISKYETTIKDFYSFVQDTETFLSYQKKYDSDNKFWLMYSGKENYPIDFISGFEALAYCQWYSKKTGKTYRLPTSSEWEYAAMKNTKQKYPWGNNPNLVYSLGTTEVVDRYQLPVDKVSEDVSPFGVYGMYGGGEYVLDSYVEDFYTKSPIINPVSVNPNGSAIISKRSSGRYNNLGDDIGMFFSSWSSFGTWSRNSFRIVEDKGIVFNENTEEECVFYQSRGKIDSKTKDVYETPMINANVVDSINDKEVFILFVSKKQTGTWYKIYYESMEDSYIYWKTGWMKSEDILENNEKWYE